ncbi:tRNA (adenosine(37)-N6)-threonylcarbamoyltransferase complex dimerization subunit type 1 TsaB [Lactococcus termiticola]|uniref:tRNA threonylcarbamoyladenosine biosynthesis protein TsaB n=1 Tax=Lactococcus termiticola TaxID=2169526 RepID=A0A2R5HIG2_9LACT|nr:tRNA (adenosine(37)-N6)-threonylcarbamoyltransferase complex dimerization subunit type 1 TsaB [Lactococcus termiticola]GBG96108.1 tRNA threonylcarbamoyladenosine biosynthesis protein TsaB [Lactococcus termiticola]
MKILAFDSSSKALAIAVTEDGKLLGEIRLNLKKNHSTTLMTSIDFLLAQMDMEGSDIDRIAVAKGPGSYTGLRLAVTVAKTLAWSMDKELVGMSSLFAIAGGLKTDGLVVPVIDARRGNAYAGLYDGANALMPDQHCKFSDFLAELKEAYPDQKLVFTGETAGFKADILEAGFEDDQIITDSEAVLPSAYALARLAETAEVVDNIHAFAPDYLKKVEAEEKWLEAHDKQDPNEAQDYVQRL